jgi:hypothetical protein
VSTPLEVIYLIDLKKFATHLGDDMYKLL